MKFTKQSTQAPNHKAKNTLLSLSFFRNARIRRSKTEIRKKKLRKKKKYFIFHGVADVISCI